MKRIPLICTPTPLHRLDRLSASLGLDLWIKRDDLTGFALGGNKGRKLEYLLAEAVESGATAVVTCGAIQSNFVRQLGAACAVAGLRCVAVVMAMPFEGQPPEMPGIGDSNGNMRLDEILGVELRLQLDGTWDELYAATESVALELEGDGEKVYRVPVGGSSPLGAYAFNQAGAELSDQVKPFDAIVFASSSGSTHVGLAWHFRGTNTKIIGIACDPEPELVHDFAELSAGLAKMLGSGTGMPASEFDLRMGYVGPGYGIPSRDGQAAIELLARTEGIFLDPVYTGKAFAGLLDLAKRGELTGRVLFWHTGGVPALFATA